MSIDKVYRDNIRGRLTELSDLAIQRKLWLNESNDTGRISSFNELMCSLFDDFHFDEFVDTYAVKNRFPGNLVTHLRSLRDALNQYKEKDTDAAIINDPEWIKITGQAKDVLKLWFTAAQA